MLSCDPRNVRQKTPASGRKRIRSLYSSRVISSPPLSLGMEPFDICERSEIRLGEPETMVSWSGTRYGPMKLASRTCSPSNKNLGLLDLRPRPIIDTITAAFLDAKFLQTNEGTAKRISRSSPRKAGQNRAT